MKNVPGVFVAADGTGVVTYGHRVLCANCHGDSFRIAVIYLTNGNHEHITCTQCGVCYCDNRCSDGGTMVPPAQVEKN
jgi:hypothetical protein